MRGKFISFEGIDGAGKTSHINGVFNFIKAKNHHVICTREPGGTPLGERLREILLSEPMHLETEALLMFAARREHLAKLIEPALERGDWVVCDRFTDATYAYQHGGRGLDLQKFYDLEQWVHGHLQPDLTLLFDLPFSVAHERIAQQTRERDRFEQERADFHERVRQAYLERAASAPQRICVVDANQSVEAIKKSLEATLETLF